MFRSERLDMERPALHEAIGAARHALAAASSARSGGGPAGLAAATALWSLVHGFALLLIDGRLQGVLEGVPGHDPDTTFDCMVFK